MKVWVLYKKLRLNFLQKQWLHMILENFSPQRCCKIWPFRKWKSLAECRSAIPVVSMEYFGVLHLKKMLSNNFPNLKGFHYRHIPGKCLFIASKARNVCYNEVPHDCRGSFALKQKLFLSSIIRPFFVKMNPSCFTNKMTSYDTAHFHLRDLA